MPDKETQRVIFGSRARGSPSPREAFDMIQKGSSYVLMEVGTVHVPQFPTSRYHLEVPPPQAQDLFPEAHMVSIKF